jgi:hypothetical protein
MADQVYIVGLMDNPLGPVSGLSDAQVIKSSAPHSIDTEFSELITHNGDDIENIVLYKAVPLDLDIEMEPRIDFVDTKIEVRG